MNSIIIDLQREALDSSQSVTELLRKAYVVARKLKVKELKDWIDSELNGHKCKYEDIPEYRNVNGETKGWNPYRGWIPLLIDDTKISSLLSSRKLPDPITNLEALINSDFDRLTVTFNAEIRRQLSEWTQFDTDYKMLFSKTQVQSIIESVRNIVLEWALKLEEEGILGEDMSFSEDEKSKAKDMNYTTNNFYGNVTNS
ncbi:hypothetical protein [Sporosalibacterium faouarense]|uniref:AbiTii domain-containing protein n=1 Tax=Sporosalibacterium faouarense TaxID=516123 RepID=UPI00192B6A7F|nr:hypothetical protein [Sporosalibacterium faouarense]